MFKKKKKFCEELKFQIIATSQPKSVRKIIILWWVYLFIFSGKLVIYLYDLSNMNLPHLVLLTVKAEGKCFLAWLQYCMCTGYKKTSNMWDGYSALEQVYHQNAGWHKEHPTFQVHMLSATESSTCHIMHDHAWLTLLLYTKSMSQWTSFNLLLGKSHSGVMKYISECISFSSFIITCVCDITLSWHIAKISSTVTDWILSKWGEIATTTKRYHHFYK
jgi:hypothetical protein